MLFPTRRYPTFMVMDPYHLSSRTEVHNYNTIGLHVALRRVVETHISYTYEGLLTDPTSFVLSLLLRNINLSKKKKKGNGICDRVGLCLSYLPSQNFNPSSDCGPGARQPNVTYVDNMYFQEHLRVSLIVSSIPPHILSPPSHLQQPEDATLNRSYHS